MGKMTFAAATLCAAAALLVAGPVMAGGTFGITEAGTAFSTDMTGLGFAMVVAGLVVAGIVMVVHFLSAVQMTSGAVVGGVLAGNALAIAGLIVPAAGGAGVSGYTGMRVIETAATYANVLLV